MLLAFGHSIALKWDLLAIFNIYCSQFIRYFIFLYIFISGISIYSRKLTYFRRIKLILECDVINTFYCIIFVSEYRFNRYEIFFKGAQSWNSSAYDQRQNKYSLKVLMSFWSNSQLSAIGRFTRWSALTRMTND